MSELVLYKMKLSILIPARNEEFLNRTIQDILSNIQGETEIIVVLDGYETELVNDPRVRVIRNKEAVGQRAATNQACKLSEAKYVMKVDAHCSFDKGFDVKMMNDMQDDWTMVPIMRNLHAFDWVCPEGHRRYQGQSGPCTICNADTIKDIVWIAKNNPQSTSYCFDEEPHFQYFNDYKKRSEYKEKLEKDILTETMSIQGSCFMLTREKYWDLNISDESLGSWGSQGIEVACKTWLSGGRVVVNHKTWYSHLFRTAGGDFGFPYPQSGKQTDHAKRTVKELFFDNKWDKQVKPLSWLLEKFWPVPGWTEEMRKKIKEWPMPKKLTAGILYYTDNELEDTLANKVRKQIKNSTDMKIVSVSLKPIDFGKNIVLPLERGKLTMHKQILAGLEALDTDIVFFCEHDVLYHPSHFKFVPTNPEKYYYNGNLWRVRQSDGFSISYDHKSLSQLCAFREKLIKEYKERVRRIEIEGFNRSGYEPGTRSIRLGGFSNDTSETWKSEFPNIDIRHEKNLSASKWKPEQFKSQRSCKNWKESTVDQIGGWSGLKELIKYG